MDGKQLASVSDRKKRPRRGEAFEKFDEVPDGLFFVLFSAGLE